MDYKPTFGDYVPTITTNLNSGNTGMLRHDNSYHTSIFLTEKTLPVASPSKLGCIKLGAGLVDIGGGVINVSSALGGLTATPTPVDNQLAIWTSGSNLEGSSKLTWDGSTLIVSGNIVANGEVVAFGGLAPINWWDSMPLATSTAIGGIQLSGDATKYLNGLGQWVVVTGGSGGSSQWTTTGSDIYFANKVMVGSSSAPSKILDVRSTGTGNNISAQFDNENTTAGNYNFIDVIQSILAGHYHAYIGTNTSGVIKINSDSLTANHLTINTAGNIGVGTLPDTYPRLALQSANAAGNTAVWQTFKNSTGTTKWGFSEYASGDFNIYEAGVADGRIYLKAGGNVGIGQTLFASDSKLALTGGWLDVDRSYGLRFSVGTTTRGTIYSNSGNDIIINPYGAGEALVAKYSSGNIGIGTNAPQSKLDVNGSIHISGAGLLTPAGALYYGMFPHSGVGLGLYSGAGAISFWTGNSPVEGMRLTGSNLNVVGEVASFYTSDQRLKTNIKSFSALDIINKLKPVEFNWNGKAKELNTEKDDRKNYGLIAQEIEQVLPELIHPIYKEYKSVDYIQLIPILIQAIKELQQEIYRISKSI